MQHVTEHLDLEASPGSAEPDLGPRSALVAVHTDWRSYYDRPTISEQYAAILGDPYRCRVNALFYAFWDNDRIAGGNMLPFFARVAREQPEDVSDSEDAASEDEIEYDEDYSESESEDGYEDDSDDAWDGEFALGHEDLEGGIDSDAFSWYSSGGEEEEQSGDEYEDDPHTW